MTLHPEARALLDAFASVPPIDYDTITAAEFRQIFVPPPPAPVPLHEVTDRDLPTATGPLRVRVYRPGPEAGLPVTAYFHGGGFVIGDLDMTDAICRTLAAEAGSLVVSVDYRLAPEAPYPAGLDDCQAAVDWLARHAETLGGDSARLAVAGDSSGGNFAAAIAQQCARDGVALAHQVLLYPVLDHEFGTPTYEAYAEGYLLTRDLMRWYYRQYLAGGGDGRDPRVSPRRAVHLAEVAPASIHTAEYDPLRAEAEGYADALEAEGVPVALRQWPGQLHGFLLQVGSNDAAAEVLQEVGQALRRAFG
ncbi:MAG: alpha/beta hydrolase [Nocardioidaceae bacterium]|nr:alpha/beta hydrolase [Nocardioidaceae bacterium]